MTPRREAHLEPVDLERLDLAVGGSKLRGIAKVERYLTERLRSRISGLNADARRGGQLANKPGPNGVQDFAKAIEAGEEANRLQNVVDHGGVVRKAGAWLGL